jgi:hypothetical protein
MPNTEYEQLRARGGSVSDQQTINTILATTDLLVRSVADAIERLRGITIDTGKATITQDNYRMDDDFGRPAALTVHRAGAVVGRGHGPDQPADHLAGPVPGRDGSHRPGTGQDVGCLGHVDPRAAVAGVGHPVRHRARRRRVPPRRPSTRSGRCCSPTASRRSSSTTGASRSPARSPGSCRTTGSTPCRRRSTPNDFAGTELGATFWGRTLSSLEAGWGIEDTEQPGIVTGVFRNEKPPMGVEVFADAIGEPVLANADLSMSVKVL